MLRGVKNFILKNVVISLACAAFLMSWSVSGWAVEATRQDQDSEEIRKDLDFGHSKRGHAFDVGPRTKAKLLPGMPKIEFSSSAKNADARKFILQGLGQLHGFANYEAERSFRTAESIEPNCAFAFFGMAMANTIFDTGSKERAYSFLKHARELSKSKKNPKLACDSPLERAFLDAAWKLYEPWDLKLASGVPNWDRNWDERILGRKAMVDALKKITIDFPNEVEGYAFYALFKWYFNSDGRDPIDPLYQEGNLKVLSSSVVDEIENSLDSVFVKNPLHPAHHYRVHLYEELKHLKERKYRRSNGVEMKAFEFALESAARIGASGKGIAHLWHMAIHTYNEGFGNDRTWMSGVLWNGEAAQRVEHQTLKLTRESPLEIHNYVHNAGWIGQELFREGDAFTGEEIGLGLTRLPLKSGQSGNNSLKIGFNLVGNDDAFDAGIYLLSLGLEKGLSSRLADVQIPRSRFGSEHERAAYVYALRALALASQGQSAKASQEAQIAQSELVAWAAHSKRSLDDVTSDKQDKEKQKSMSVRALHALDAVQLIQSLFEAEADSKSAIAQAQALTKFYLEALAPAGMAESALLLIQTLIDRRSFHSATELFGVFLQRDSAGFEYLEASTAAGKLRLLNALLQVQRQLGTDVHREGWLKVFSKVSNYVVISRLVATRPQSRDVIQLFELAPELHRDYQNAFRWDPRFEDKILAPRPALEDLGPLTYQSPQAPKVLRKTLTRSKGPVLLVFELGSECWRCSEQASALQKQEKEFERLGVEVILVAPKSQAAISLGATSTIRSITADPSVYRSFGVVDDFEKNVILHGVFLVDSQNRILWQDVGSKPYLDIEGLAEETERLLRP
jgi:peroxiredoxin